MLRVRKLIVTLGLASVVLLGSTGSALAEANDGASCLGQSASAVPPGSKDDVAHLITTIARAEGTNHGQVVKGFAHQHSGCPFVP
jgi:hypothetical protein